MRKLLLLLLLCTGFMACENQSIEEMESAISEDVTARKGTKFSVCHKDAGEIVLSESALQTHIDHGDAVDMDGDGFYDIENPCSEIDLDDSKPFDQSTLVDEDGDGYFTTVNPFSEIDCDDTTPSEDNSCVKTAITNYNIRWAVKGWVQNQRATEATYGHISDWNTYNVTDMSYLFFAEDDDFISNFRNFNDDISGWDVSNVTNMEGMFDSAFSFNQDLNDWDVDKVTNMKNMFSSTPFNGKISDWDVSNVTTMEGMFAGSFNQDISGWEVDKVTNMYGMFSNAYSFNQNLSGWDVSSVTECRLFSFRAVAWTLPKPNFTNCTP